MLAGILLQMPNSIQSLCHGISWLYVFFIWVATRKKHLNLVPFQVVFSFVLGCLFFNPSVIIWVCYIHQSNNQLQSDKSASIDIVLEIFHPCTTFYPIFVCLFQIWGYLILELPHAL